MIRGLKNKIRTNEFCRILNLINDHLKDDRRLKVKDRKHQLVVEIYKLYGDSCFYADKVGYISIAIKKDLVRTLKILRSIRDKDI